MNHATRLPLLLSLALLTLLPAGLRAQSFSSLHERLGDNLDAYERVYFGFFPGLEGFTSAQLIADGNGLRFVVHRTAGAADSIIALTHREAVLLERLVDGYESILQDYPGGEHDTPDNEDRQVLELRYAPLPQRGILRLRRADLNDPRSVRVGLRNGELLEGTMLFRTDSTLALRGIDGPFRWRSADSGVRMLRYGDIADITCRRSSGSFSEGVGTGFLVGLGSAMLLLSTIMERSGNTSWTVPWIDYAEPLLEIGTVVGGLPGALIGGLLAIAPVRTSTWSGSALPGAWDIDRSASDELFVFPRLRPPELVSTSGAATTAPGILSVTVWPPILRSRPAAARQDTAVALPASDMMHAASDRTDVRFSSAVDYAMHFYGRENREVGISAGGSLALEVPLLIGESRRHLLSFRPRVGLGKQYAVADLSVLTPRVAGVYLLGGISSQWMNEEFGTACSGGTTEIVQNTAGDFLFASGGIGYDRGSSYLELQLRAPFRRIVVTTGDPGTRFCDSPAPKNFVSVQLSWGWRL